MNLCALLGIEVSTSALTEGAPKKSVGQLAVTIDVFAELAALALAFPCPATLAYLEAEVKPALGSERPTLYQPNLVKGSKIPAATAPHSERLEGFSGLRGCRRPVLTRLSTRPWTSRPRAVPTACPDVCWVISSCVQTA